MHLVLINQYYPPDEAPTGVMLEAVAEQLVAAGHQVTVLCSAGGYAVGNRGGGRRSALYPTVESSSSSDGRRSERKAEGLSRDAGAAGHGVSVEDSSHRVVRIGATAFGRGSFVGKLLDYAGFYLGVAVWLMAPWNRYDRVVVLTTPPYLSLLARWGSKFSGADHGHWVMDLYPDVMMAHGMLKNRSFGAWMLRRLSRHGFGGKRCGFVLGLGPDMAGRIDRYLTGSRQAEWIPLWGGTRVTAGGTMDKAAYRLRHERGWRDEEIVVMYSGNMGLGHRFGEILEVVARRARRGLSDGMRFAFFGDGKRRGELEAFLRRYPGSGLELSGYVAGGSLEEHLGSADLHLVSLDPSWDGTMVPSKLQGIFAAGRPALFVGSRTSSIGRWILESGGGWVVEPGDIDALEAVLEEAADAGERQRRGQAAACFAAERFDRATNAARCASLLSRREHHAAAASRPAERA